MYLYYIYIYIYNLLYSQLYSIIRHTNNNLFTDAIKQDFKDMRRKMASK